MSATDIIENELVLDPSSVWLLKGHQTFAYSDGAASERYLEAAFRSSDDLSTRSPDLQRYINDWTTEYHLTVKRSQLLSPFTFDRSLKVLEVGCGCGAITRYLGETFDDVTSVEGSLSRARLARLRTRDLENVSVVCAPFQEVRFKEKFDVIFVIGVFEYSASFVAGDDPYDAALRYFSDILKPDGMIVMAIENQFGLKYFNGAHEDHIGRPFEGLEGYRRRPPTVRTFGRLELEMRLRRHFSSVDFFYPYPDYKIPDAVLSEKFLSSVHAGEFVGNMDSRSYIGRRWRLWDELPTVLELARNRQMPFFANSFLVIAGRSEIRGVVFDQLAAFYSSGRTPSFTTQTKIQEGANGGWHVTKRLMGEPSSGSSPIALAETESNWIDDVSLETTVGLRARQRDNSLDTIFEPCRVWLEFLSGKSTIKNGRAWLEGEHIDSLWANFYSTSDGPQLVDREWRWRQDLPLNVVVVRAIIQSLKRMEKNSSISRALRIRSGRTLTFAIAKVLGLELKNEDIEEFVTIEIAMQAAVTGADPLLLKRYWRWFFADRPSLSLSLESYRWVRGQGQRVLARMANARPTRQ